MVKIITGLLSLLILISPPTALAVTQRDISENRPAGRIIVKFKTNTPQSRIDSDIAARSARLSTRIERLNALALEVDPARENLRLAQFRALPEVEYAEPDQLATVQVSTNDPSISQEWGIFKIQAAATSTLSAWDITTGNAATKVAILDTGIDQNHIDLSAKITANQNFTTSSSPDDFYGHGTHVAGTVAAITNNATGVAGVGYNTSLMNVKVLGNNGSGYYSWIANGIIWATDNGAKVMT